MATSPNPKNDNPTPQPSNSTTQTTTEKTSTSSDSTEKTSQKTVASSETKVIPGVSQEVINSLNEEINLMLAFAAHNGMIINTDVNSLIQSDNVDDLINAHNLLCKNVAPATPKSIAYTNRIQFNGNSKSIFRQIPLVRNLILLAVFFLIAYIALGQTSAVNNDSLDKGVLNNQGLDLILNLGFLASISGLGVLFHLLKKVSSSVLNSTLVPEETISYASQILLGIISGLILSEIISVYTQDPTEINLFNKSVLALIGGFSSDAIFSILEGLITRLKTIFVPANSQ